MKAKRLFVIATLSLALALPALSAKAEAGEGKKLFEAKKCGSCHQIQGPAREKTIKDQLAKKGPELWYAGSKFKKEFLSRWLAEPRPIRPLEYNSIAARNPNNHPRLSAQEASEVTEFLMSITSSEAKSFGITAKDNPKGRAIFIKKQACYGCHEVAVRGTTAGGLSAPSLKGAGSRLQTDWIYAYLTNPKAFKPVKSMPVYAGILRDDEIKDLAAYVGSLN